MPIKKSPKKYNNQSYNLFAKTKREEITKKMRRKYKEKFSPKFVEQELGRIWKGLIKRTKDKWRRKSTYNKNLEIVIKAIPPEENWEKLENRMRSAISGEIEEFKQNNPNRKCSLLEPHRGEMEVDHFGKYQFKDIKMSFLRQWLSEMGKTIHSPNFSETWRMYHKKHMRLRWLCEQHNQRKKRI